LSPSLIKRQVQRLVLNGYPEIVICGVDLGSYGQDFISAADQDQADTKARQDFDLVVLLRELLSLECAQDNPFRIRLSSIDPYHISDQLIDLIATEARICSQFHLSLQSGNTLILKRMKRRYDADHVRERIAKLRRALPDLVLSADVMVGFPTETEEQYADTEQMVRDLEIAFPHVFSYSERSGTPASRIPTAKQVPVEVRKQRNKRLRETGAIILDELLATSLGKTAWVLPEKEAKRAGYMLCRAENYLPVLVPSDQVSKGSWCKVSYQTLENGHLTANKLSLS
jgi:threonylcarbamoyladenosine tRNA methylthiotransferase MtaB